MRSRLLSVMVVLCAGCHACDVAVPDTVECDVAAIACAHVAANAMPCADLQLIPDCELDLPSLWELALKHNPALREAAADLEASRGQALQASKYPNPRLAYSEESIGTPQAAAGALVVQVTQEIVTAHKRELDMAVAGQGVSAARVALLGRKLDVLTRIRRAYYDYVSSWNTMQAQQQVLATLEQGLAITREQVKLEFRLAVDLTRLQANYEQARSNLERSQILLEASWRQLVAEVGVPALCPPSAPVTAPEPAPQWERCAVLARVLAASTDRKQAALEVEQARLAWERAQAEACPNVTVGGGYSRNFAENEVGGVVSLEMPLPLWDRKQGRIYEAQARWVKAQAVERSTHNRLARDTAEAFGRYEAARQQEASLHRIQPLLEKSLTLVREAYKTSRETTIADVLLAEEALNDNRLRLQEIRRDLWRAIADLEGLMRLDLGEEHLLADQAACEQVTQPAAEAISTVPPTRR